MSDAPFDPAEFEQALFSRLVKATRLSNALPAPGDDLEYCTTFPGFRQASASVGARVLSLIEQMLQQRGAQPLARAAGDDERYERVVDMCDQLLEQADFAYDSAQGVINRTLHSLEGEAGASAPRNTAVGQQQKQLLRPQLKWKDEIDNSDAPFIPKLRSKPNAILPLDESMSHALASAHAQQPLSVRRPSEDLGALAAKAADPALRRAAALRAHASDLGLVGASAGPNAASAYSFGHPYDAEVAAFEPSPEQLRVSSEQLYRPLHETPCEWVCDAEGIERMLEHLAGAREIALDLEHHSLHSYRGFTCLLQVSTRGQDFLVDTLECRALLGPLNSVLTDPNITKVRAGLRASTGATRARAAVRLAHRARRSLVRRSSLVPRPPRPPRLLVPLVAAQVLHGSDSDVIWLQRDLGLYLVGLFDTGQAARQLSLPSAALSHVLRVRPASRASARARRLDRRERSARGPAHAPPLASRSASLPRFLSASLPPSLARCSPRALSTFAA
jgi:exosome complex exonuclease RRP6